MASESTDATATIPDHADFTLIAGDCRIEVDADEHYTYRGQVLVLVKPDDTVLIHDVDGYQPVAWITRADRVIVDDEAGSLTAIDGDRWLRVHVIASLVDRQLPGTAAGTPIGDCPDCGGQLVDVGDAVHCVSCRSRYGIPRDATIIDSQCSCGKPMMRIERGEVFDLCIDRDCEPMAEAIADRFDGIWSCPDSTCDGSLRVIHRGQLLLGCDQYPNCEMSFRFPTGRIDGHCNCGLPRFRSSDGSQCLDRSCRPTA